jgi:SAM-dependent methyltransferase
LYWNDLSRHGVDVDALVTWLADPVVRRRVNTRVTGSPERWPTDWVRAHLASVIPLRRAVSVGSGVGNLERDLLRKGVVSSIVGVDLAPAAVAFARLRAEEEGLSPDAISYVAAEAREFLSRQVDLDAVFFHGSLHHFDRLAGLLRLVASSLKPSGLLVIDEYVGPSMHEWGIASLVIPNLVYRCLPRQLRRTHLIRAPLNPSDPTEMICSSQIRKALSEQFRIEAARDYGGNLISLIYPSLRRPGADVGAPSAEEFARAVTLVLDVEDRLLSLPALLRPSSHYSVMIASRAPTRRYCARPAPPRPWCWSREPEERRCTSPGVGGGS